MDAYVDNSSFSEMNQYARERMAKNTKADRKPYSFTSNNCGTFMFDVLEAGDANTPWIINPTPHNYIDELRENYPHVNYSP